MEKFRLIVFGVLITLVFTLASCDNVDNKSSESSEYASSSSINEKSDSDEKRKGDQLAGQGEISISAEEVVKNLMGEIRTIDNIIVRDMVSGQLGETCVEKAVFADKRISQTDSANPSGGTIETFSTSREAEIRKQQLMADKVSDLHYYQYKNVLLGINGRMTTEQIAEYEEAFYRIMSE